MYTVQVNPAIVVHNFVSGASVTGVAPTGKAMVDSQETLWRGRIRKYSNCDDGGLVAVAPRMGSTITRVTWNLPGISELQIFRMDDDDILYTLYTASKDITLLDETSGIFMPQDNEVFIPPDWFVVAVATGSLSDVGAIAFDFEIGWDQNAPDTDAGTIGVSTRPPGQARP